jgi:cyclopropane fatty-acyl-phospholipid synthase-like methyltransferase
MFAQDIRKFVHDGAPPESVYGTDLRREYFTYGYKLFRDENIIPKDHFIAADILDTNDHGLNALAGKLDVINATHVIHVFTLEDQREFIKHLMALLKQENGVMCTGRMAGHLQPGYKEGVIFRSIMRRVSRSCGRVLGMRWGRSGM